MINKISTGRYLTSYNFNSINIDPLPECGQMRYKHGRVEYNSGTAWYELQGDAAVDLSFEAVQILEWAKQKMIEEMNEKTILEKYPALLNAKNTYDMIKQICQAEEKLDNNK